MTVQANSEKNITVAQPLTVHDVANTVLVIPAGRTDEPVCSAVRQRVPVSCVRLDAESAISHLRVNPLDITAVILCGDGKSATSTAILDSIKSVAPRVPIVFLDERESSESELSIRRAGIHYYTHLPVNSGEIAAVLTHLAEAPRANQSSPA